MNLNSSSVFQWMSHDYQYQKCAEILLLRPGREGKPSYGRATKQYKCRMCMAQQATETSCTKESIQKEPKLLTGEIVMNK